jgi:hypothetical protein
MTTGFVRVASYGQPVFRGLTGPLWRHVCGETTSVDLLDGDVHPGDRECAGCLGQGRHDWRPLFAYHGPLCDQCNGNGWVPVAGKVDGAVCGYETVVECTACEASGVAR